MKQLPMLALTRHCAGSLARSFFVLFFVFLVVCVCVFVLVSCVLGVCACVIFGGRVERVSVQKEGGESALRPRMCAWLPAPARPPRAQAVCVC